MSSVGARVGGGGEIASLGRVRRRCGRARALWFKTRSHVAAYRSWEPALVRPRIGPPPPWFAHTIGMTASSMNDRARHSRYDFTFDGYTSSLPDHFRRSLQSPGDRFSPTTSLERHMTATPDNHHWPPPRARRLDVSLHDDYTGHTRRFFLVVLSARRVLVSANTFTRDLSSFLSRHSESWRTVIVVRESPMPLSVRKRVPFSIFNMKTGISPGVKIRSLIARAKAISTFSRDHGNATSSHLAVRYL